MATSNSNNGQPYYVDALLYPKESRWNASRPVGTPVNVTYSFMTSNPGNSKDANFVAFTQKQSEFFDQRLKEWGEFANITFTRINNGNKGQIRFGMTDLGGQGLSSSPNPGGSTNTWIDKHWSKDFDTTPGHFLWSLALHEMGHALGLAHPGPYNFGSKEADDAYSKQNNYMRKGEDNTQYTLMSYNDGLNGRVKYTGSEAAPLTPLLYDIATIQYLYGANRNTRTGNDVYSWNPSTAFTQTIWDAGGIDTISAANQTLSATINLNAGAFSSIGSHSDGSSTPATNNLAIAYAVAGINSTIENAIGGTNNDTIYGNSANNVLQGSGGGDYIDGWEGDDILYGGTSTNFTNTGNDVLVAWKGNDQLYGGDGDDWLDGSYDDDILYGGDGNDTLGNSVAPESGNDKMYGEAGNDAIYGGSGNDILGGGDGTDQLYGGAGDDHLKGNSGFSDSSSDSLYGDAGNDVLLGGSGADYLDGGSGADTMTGYGGDDTYVVDNALDVINETSGTGIETVISSIGFRLGADSKGLDNLTLVDTRLASGGIGNGIDNAITGNSYVNSLDGSGGTDILNGLGGNDSLIGGTGTDTLTGGTGKDTFYFQSKNEGIDRITDFSVVDDTINVSQAEFGAGLNVGTLLASQFVLGSSATNSSQRFIYNQSNGGLYFDADGNGGAAKIQIASLSTGLSLTNNDIYAYRTS